MDPILIESSVLALFGGLVFGFIMNRVLPFFGIPRVNIRLTLYAMGTIAFLFWATWLFPQLFVLVVNGRGTVIILVLSVIFLLFVIGLLGVTYVLGRLSKADEEEGDGY